MAETRETNVPTPRELQALIEAERSGLPFVHWRDGDGQQQLVMLSPDLVRVTVGRREQSDVSLHWDAEVSRAHALLEPIGDEWTVVDDGLSRNGTFVNGSRVHGRQRLHHKDRMCFGNTHVTYHGPSGGQGSQSTARAPGAPSAVPLTATQRKVVIALCRPIVEETSSTPATNPQIAAEVSLSVDAVKAHLRGLFERFDLGELAQNEKRNRLVSAVLSSGLLARHDF